MSPEVKLLHNAARHYCSEHYRLWSSRYDKLAENGRDRRGYDYTKEAYRIFPRYQVLRAIQAEIERLTDFDLVDLREARELFAHIGLTAENEFTSHDRPEAQEAEQIERDAFAAFMRDVPQEVISAIDPLPYVRVLLDDESERVWAAVALEWGLHARQYWYPLAETDRLDVEAFQIDQVRGVVPPEWLKSALARRGIERVWELREYGPDYELDVTVVNPHYNGAEGFWTSASLDWIVYVSHEGTITIGGWMLNELKGIWPGWERYV